MRNYVVALTVAGPLTQVPDSQKLFGSLIYLLAEQYGDAHATALTKMILDKKVHLALSDIMPQGYLPAPQDYWDDLITETNGEERKRLHAAIKKRSYIADWQLEELQWQPAIAVSRKPFVELQSRHQPRASLESIRYDIPELDPKLFSVPTVEVVETVADEKDGRKHTERPVKEFYFCAQMDDSAANEELLETIREVIAAGRTVILGKRASQGMNTFRFTGITERTVSRSSSSLYLNTGMLLPDQIDFKRSVIRLFTSERRPYEMADGWNPQMDKQSISFIAPGSVICAPKGPEKAGRCVVSPFRKDRDIVFGNAFLYPMPLKGKKVQG